MPSELEGVFKELGLSQYLDAFTEQGFDKWETILDIQESDLDALGVKLGHRRKLQRRIANARGIAPSISLADIRATLEDVKQNGSRHDHGRWEGNPETNGVAKRKYRRHPKSDENAPERPPSAYVLFSNKMRDDLKSQNLTFTEIAKLVGENWQSLAPAERDIYETQANTAKDKYRRDMAEYKKTPQYRKYSQYLHDFKEKQARHNQTKAQGASKRTKMEPARLRHGSSSSSATPGTATMSSGTGSGSNSERFAEPEPLGRQNRVNSSASIAGSPLSSTGFTPLSHRNSLEEANTSPRSVQYDLSSRDPRGSMRLASWIERDGVRVAAPPNLPPLSDMLADGKAASRDRQVPTQYSGRDRRRALPDRLPPPNHNGDSISTAPMRGVVNAPRNGTEGAVPIHALLSGKTAGAVAPPNTGYNGSMGYGFQNDSSAFGRMRVERGGDGDIIMTAAEDEPKTDKAKSNLDGMSALLRAGELVDQSRR